MYFPEVVTWQTVPSILTVIFEQSDATMELTVPFLKDFEKYFVLRLAQAKGGKSGGMLNCMEMMHIIIRMFFGFSETCEESENWTEGEVSFIHSGSTR